MSAYGGKADIDQPFLTDLNLWVHSQARQLSEAAGTRIDRLYLGPIVLWSQSQYLLVRGLGIRVGTRQCQLLLSYSGGFGAVGSLFVSDAMLAEPPICLTKFEYVRVGLWWQLF